MEGNSKIEKNKSIFRFIYLIIVFLLIVNWLFNPRYGIFHDPCLADAMHRDIIGFEGSKNAWVVYFTNSHEISKLYNNGGVIGINSCGYQWGKSSAEALFFFGPFVLIFSLFFLNLYSVGFKKTIEVWNQKKEKKE